ncbi:Golgi transport complex subunit 5-domain-containing protein [Sphaerosporella brunnea]|uniref:Conserved oligomeric Golgi complex subunit 5 n=1 Tax=Sphaerosporella brunnea TaxID=1250544 RepID=A0A5J5EZS4_9PEZI|nr:Golgi transport complex subunit 5-domain-containing protein [Sphaerosporella brunnea]KAA8908099.1 Golgi transport complex subunit 5-domain-containing protein [Sphaerosporella brunnea]
MATTTNAQEDEDTTYIDYEAFLEPTFSPYRFANTLITSTNDPSDPSLDLTTPLSRVLFDLQEIDTHIHSLTTTSALPLLAYTDNSYAASSAVLAAVDAQLDSLRRAYERLQKDVAARSLAASEVLTVVERLHSVTTQLRELSRALVIARQIEIQLSELQSDHKALVRAAQNLRELRVGRVLADVDAGVTLAQDLRRHIFAPAETFILNKAREEVVAFDVSTTTTTTTTMPPPGGEVAAQAALALFLLSKEGEGSLLTSAVQSLLNAAVNASLAALTRSLTALTTLDRSVAEVAARCQNLVALQELLMGIALPSDDDDESSNDDNEAVAAAGSKAKSRSLLDPLLRQLDSASLSSMFFRSVAAGLEPRVREVVGRGGANARILKGAKDRVRGALRACVERGLGSPVEFEVAVMVGAAGVLGR